MSVASVRWCEVDLKGKRMKEVKEFKYFGTVLCKHIEMEEKIRERELRKAGVP